MLKYLLRFDQVDDRGCQASIFTEGPGSARQPGRRPRRSTAWCSSCSLQACGRLLKPTGTVLRQVGLVIHVYYIWSNLMQSMHGWRMLWTDILVKGLWGDEHNQWWTNSQTWFCHWDDVQEDRRSYETTCKTWDIAEMRSVVSPQMKHFKLHYK